MEERIKRGEIYMVNIEGTYANNTHIQSSARPMLIIQNDVGNRYSPTVIGALITSREKKDYPMHQEVMLDKESTIMFEQLLTVDKSRLIRKMGELTPNEMMEAETRLSYSLGMINPILSTVNRLKVTKKIEEETRSDKEVFYVAEVEFDNCAGKEVRIPERSLEALDEKTLDKVEKYLKTLQGLKILVENMFLNY